MPALAPHPAATRQPLLRPAGWLLLAANVLAWAVAVCIILACGPQ